jgi:hypothetical protein
MLVGALPSVFMPTSTTRASWREGSLGRGLRSCVLCEWLASRAADETIPAVGMMEV